jgi:hypothetical protein
MHVNPLGDAIGVKDLTILGLTAQRPVRSDQVHKRYANQVKEGHADKGDD